MAPFFPPIEMYWELIFKSRNAIKNVFSDNLSWGRLYVLEIGFVFIEKIA